MVQQTELEIEQSFKYNFKEIEEQNYEVDPANVSQNGEEVRFKFFHRQEQKDQVRNAVSLYENHPGGISRMLYRQNLKKLYRDFQQV